MKSLLDNVSTKELELQETTEKMLYHLVTSQMEGNDHSVANTGESIVQNPEHSMLNTIEHSASQQTDVSRIHNATDEITSNEEPREHTSEHQDSSEGETVKSDSAKLDNINEEEVQVKELKSILKRRGQYTMRKVKVDFDLIPQRIPFDETKDYTVEILIVDKEPVKIKSWAAIFAAKKAEAEAEAAAIAEADAALKKAEEVKKREALKKANKAKSADKKNSDREEHRMDDDDAEGVVAHQKPVQTEQTAPQVEDVGNTVRMETQENEMTITTGDQQQPSLNVVVDADMPETGDDDLKVLNVEESVQSESENIVQQNEELVQFQQTTDDEVSEQFSEEIKGVGNDFHPLPNIETQSEETVSTDITPDFDNSIDEKLQLTEDVLVTAVDLVDDILAETPKRMKDISYDTETDIADSTESEKDCHYEDKSDSSIQELLSEDLMNSLNAELQNELSISESILTDVSSEHINELSDSKCTTTITTTEELRTEANEQETRESIPNHTDKHKANINSAIVSQKLQESLKKASPEIIKSAVRVLVDIEKVTLAVVKNLEPLVP